MEMGLGRNVGKLRAARHLSYGDIARGIGIEDPQAIHALVKRNSKKSGFASKLAAFFEVDLERLLADDFDVQEVKTKPSPKTVDLPAREEILLELYRGLFDHQQKRLIQGLRALFQANQIVRKELGHKPLRGVSDETVERAFGKVPATAKKKGKAAKPERDPGAAMDDFLGE